MIVVKVDKSQIARFMTAATEGLPFVPSHDKQWSKSELIMVAGAIYASALGQSQLQHHRLPSDTVASEEDFTRSLETDLLAALEYVSQVARGERQAGSGQQYTIIDRAADGRLTTESIEAGLPDLQLGWLGPLGIKRGSGLFPPSDV